MAETSGLHNWDVIILGTGLYGIQAARTYLEIHPQSRLVILESDDVVGGTWSSNRNYDAFWTQSPVGMAEFSDRVLKPPPKEDQYFGFFPARFVTEYLESYVDDHVYDGKTLRERILFNIRVQHVEKLERNWIVTCDGSARSFRAPRLIDATGLTSLPHIPSIPGQAEFRGLAIHHKQFGQSYLLTDPKIQSIAVIGGSKSAADVAYAAAKAGKTTSWVIRKNGSGPCALFSAEATGPYANSNEQLHTRLMKLFLSSPFEKTSILDRFLHRCTLGKWFFRKMWAGTNKDIRMQGDFSRKEGRKNGFQNLEPDTPVFWANDSPGVCQRSDFHSTIATQVRIYRQDIARLDPHAVILEPDGKTNSATQDTIKVHAIVFCTGWVSTSPLYSHSLALSLGLPVPSLELNLAERSLWESSISANKATVVKKFPILRQQPKCHQGEFPCTPFRLYKGMAPPLNAIDHSIVFLGKLFVSNNFRLAEVQALWAVAFLDGKILHAKSDRGGDSQLDEKEQREEEIANTIAWCRQRYPGKGKAGNWFFYDVISYTDMILRQLGLQSHRRKGWFRNFFAPCLASDLREILDEYKQVYPAS